MPRDASCGEGQQQLNLQRAPFLLGAPLESIAEYDDGSDDPFADKALALWAMDEVRAALR